MMDAVPVRSNQRSPHGRVGGGPPPRNLLLAAIAAGLAAAAAFNAFRWPGDRAVAETMRRETPPRPRLAATPRVSVIVAAWNEAARIDDHVRSALTLRYPDLEYVLCAGGEDGTFARAKRYARPGVVVLEQAAGEGKQAALRRCLARVNGDVVFLTDADCLLDDDTLERTIAPIINEGETVSTGTSRPLPSQLAGSDLVRCQWAIWYYRGPTVSAYVNGLMGRNAAVARSALREVGDLAIPVASGTDRFLAGQLERAGHRIRYAGDSWIASAYPTDPRHYARQQTRWLRNLVEHGVRFRDWRGTWHGVRTMLTGWAILGLAASALAASPWVWCLLAPVVGHALFARARYVAFTARATGQELPIPWVALLLTVALDAVAWSRAFVELVLPRVRRGW